MNIPILAYHNIENIFEWGINSVSPQVFEKQIRFLAYSDFKTVSLLDVIEQKKIKKKVL